MRDRIILIFITLFSVIFSLRTWVICNKFSDAYYYSSFDLELRLIEAIHTDQGVPLILVRLFHNKVLGSVLDIFNAFVRFWDLNFLITLIGFTGLFFFFIGAYHLLRSADRKITITFGLLLALLPITIILKKPDVPFIYLLISFATLLLCIAIYGIFRMKTNKWIVPGGVLLTLLTIWWSTYHTPELMQFCMQ